MNNAADERVGIFEEVKELPDPSAARRFASLVGLDETKNRLLKEARLLLDPESLTAWSERFYHKKTRIIRPVSYTHLQLSSDGHFLPEGPWNPTRHTFGG